MTIGIGFTCSGGQGSVFMRNRDGGKQGILLSYPKTILKQNPTTTLLLGCAHMTYKYVNIYIYIYIYYIYIMYVYIYIYTIYLRYKVDKVYIYIYTIYLYTLSSAYIYIYIL